MERCFGRDVTSVITDRETSTISANVTCNLRSGTVINMPSPVNSNLFGAPKCGQQKDASTALSSLCQSSPVCSPGADVSYQPVSKKNYNTILYIKVVVSHHHRKAAKIM